MRKTDNLLLEIPRDIRYLRSIKRDEKIEEGYYFGINPHTEHTWSHFDEIKKEVKDFYFYLGGNVDELLDAFALEYHEKVETLIIGDSSYGLGEGLDYSKIVRKLERYNFPNLKSFQLGTYALFHNADSIYGYVGDVTTLLQKMPKLEYLGIFGEVIITTPLEFKYLEEMDFCRWGTSFFTKGEYITQESLNALLCSTYPKLHTLWIDLEFDENEKKYEFPKEFLMNDNMPMLKKLEINGSFKEGVKKSFYQSPIVKKLDSLYIEDLKDVEFIKTVSGFINIFTLMFHTDWKRSKEVLEADLFESKWSFIHSKWISNWINRDALLEAYNTIQKTLSQDSIKIDELKNELKIFIEQFEVVFDKDWGYTQEMLSREDRDEDTFFYPKEGSKIFDWNTREHLLENYKKVKRVI